MARRGVCGGGNETLVCGRRLAPWGPAPRPCPPLSRHAHARYVCIYLVISLSFFFPALNRPTFLQASKFAARSHNTSRIGLLPSALPLRHHLSLPMPDRVPRRLALPVGIKTCRLSARTP